jgi:hypothetical protein
MTNDYIRKGLGFIGITVSSDLWKKVASSNELRIALGMEGILVSDANWDKIMKEAEIQELRESKAYRHPIWLNALMDHTFDPSSNSLQGSQKELRANCWLQIKASLPKRDGENSTVIFNEGGIKISRELAIMALISRGFFEDEIGDKVVYNTVISVREVCECYDRLQTNSAKQKIAKENEPLIQFYREWQELHKVVEEAA